MKGTQQPGGTTDALRRLWEWLLLHMTGRGVRPHPPMDHDSGEREVQRDLETRRNLHA